MATVLNGLRVTFVCLFLPMIFGHLGRLLHPSPWLMFFACFLIFWKHPPFPSWRDMFRYDPVDRFSVLGILATLYICEVGGICEYSFRARWAPPAWSTSVLVGGALLAVGTGLRLWSVATLSSAFTAAVNKSGPPELITAGPYQRIRHPSYLAMLIVVAASTILLNSVWCAVAGVALVVPAYLYRIHCEEMILRKQFGAKFDKYTGDRWKIMPFVH